MTNEWPICKDKVGQVLQVINIAVAHRRILPNRKDPDRPQTYVTFIFENQVVRRMENDKNWLPFIHLTVNKVFLNPFNAYVLEEATKDEKNNVFLGVFLVI